MKRRPLVLGGCVLALARRAQAQAGSRVRRIGFLRSGKVTGDGQLSLRQALADLGHVDGRNIDVVWRGAETPDQAAPMAHDLLQNGVELIIVHDTPVAHAVLQATRTLPIVLAGIADPVGSGLVGSLARPGGNVTGLSWNLPAVAGKKLELLKELVPAASRFGFLAAAQDPATPLFVDNTRLASQQLGVQLRIVRVDGPAQFAEGFAMLARERVQALVVQPLFSYAYRALADMALQQRMASASAFRFFAESGGTLAYGPSPRARWRRVAHYVDRILGGARPGDMPIEDPTAFELVINRRTAAALDLTVPQSLLLRADEVIA